MEITETPELVHVTLKTVVVLLSERPALERFFRKHLMRFNHDPRPVEMRGDALSGRIYWDETEEGWVTVKYDQPTNA